MRPGRSILVVIIAACCAAVRASDCSKTSIGITPLNDLGAGTYQGFAGGLYPGSSDLRPSAHDAAGLALAQSIVPLDAGGQPSANGKIGLMSIGMSNATQEWTAFLTLAGADPDRHPNLALVDGAEGGRDARDIANPGSTYWTQTIPARLQQYGVTAAQVLVLWLKEAVAQPTLPFPDHAVELNGFLRSIVQILHDTFPNARMCFLNSRSYAGYATSDLNPEPYAFEQGFAVKWLIEDQIGGDGGLNYDPGAGPVKAPWLSWGIYMWADGLTPRSDGLIWECDDFRSSDGTHPSDKGRLKVARALLHHFKSDPVCTPWFLAAGKGHCGTAAFVDLYGSGTAGTNGVPRIATTELPTVPSIDPFAIQVNGARATSTGVFFFGVIPLDVGDLPFYGGWLLTLPSAFYLRPTDGSGRALLVFPPVPDNALLCGFHGYWQYAVADPNGPTGVLALTPGLLTTFGD
ncbi:MAG: hypothetical protein U1E76_26185 [Planctomycetota bacterium]